MGGKNQVSTATYFLRSPIALALILMVSLPGAETIVTNAEEESAATAEGILVRLDAPRVRSVHDTFQLGIRIENAQAEREFKIDDVDIAGQYMQGFQLLNVTPQPKELDWSGGDLSMAYGITLQAGETLEVKLRLRAKRPGVYIGDLDVWSDKQFHTRVAQTRVIEK